MPVLFTRRSRRAMGKPVDAATNPAQAARVSARTDLRAMRQEGASKADLKARRRSFTGQLNDARLARARNTEARDVNRSRGGLGRRS